MDQDFVKKRLEKDLEDLKRMIALHFEQRKKDESELEELKNRIDKRKQVHYWPNGHKWPSEFTRSFQMREEQLRLRAERERERQEFERLEKERKAEEEGLLEFRTLDINLRIHLLRQFDDYEIF